MRIIRKNFDVIEGTRIYFHDIDGLATIEGTSVGTIKILISSIARIEECKTDAR